jgi:hypothetical protein
LDHIEPETPDELLWLAQFGQYQGAGVLTGFGLLRWHMAQRKRLPLTADFGRIFLPVLRIFSAMAASVPFYHLHLTSHHSPNYNNPMVEHPDVLIVSGGVLV